METTERQTQLENEKAVIESYLEQPISREILRDNEETVEQLERTIFAAPIVDFETFVAHFVAIGKRQGLVQARSAMHAKLEDIKEQLNEAKQ